MSFRLGGLNSGMDTDSVVQAMLAGQTLKKNNIEGKKQKLEWKKELWSDMNTKIYNFYKGSLSNMRFSSAYTTKKASSSDVSKVNVTASSGASTGTYKVKVNSVAASQYVTSGKLKGVEKDDGTIAKATGSTKLVDLKDSSFSVGTQINITAKDGAKQVSLLVEEDTTINDFVNAAKSAGLNASFDTAQQRFFISAAASGEDQKFTITAGKLSDAQMDAVKEWRDAVGYQYLSAEDKSAVQTIFNNLQNGTTTYDKVEESLNKYAAKAKKTAVTNYYKKQITESYNNKYLDASDPDNIVVTQDGKDALTAAGKMKDDMTDAEMVKAVNSLITKKVSSAMADDEVKTSINAAIAAGIRGEDITSADGESWHIEAATEDFLWYDTAVNELTLGTQAQDYNTKMSGITSEGALLGSLGLTAIDGSEVTEGSAEAEGTGMVVVKAKDASITFNGATLTSKDSTISVNGLSLEILGDTEGKEITVTVNKDTSAIYDTIKDFITDYNAVLTEMNTGYNAASASSYAMLTDDMKKSMSDDEIEKWNDKIKSSLLRRDTTLNGIISSFRNIMMGSVTTSDGKKYSLGSLGISTSTDYLEGGLLHIKGDEDDSTYSGQTNKLQKMLEEDPDKVMEVFTGLANKLYSDLGKKMSKTKLSSAMTFYNNTEMDNEITAYSKQIKKWETKISDMETRYYKQFSAMETALANLNKQSSALSGFFG